jgi:group I intron endonuclease
MNGISGIYKIINKTNGKYYVGSSCNIGTKSGQRWRGHIRRLKSNNHYNPHLQRAWNKYGKENFDWIIVEEVVKEKLIEIEQKYLDIAKDEKEKCYNISFTANQPAEGHLHMEKFRKILADETKKDILSVWLNAGWNVTRKVVKEKYGVGYKTLRKTIKEFQKSGFNREAIANQYASKCCVIRPDLSSL